MTHSANVVKAKEEVVGVDVFNRADEDLGAIQEVMLDKDSGQVAYVVLKCDDFLGLGGKLFAIPWKAIHYDTAKDAFRLDIDKDRLKNAPGFDKDSWPDMADRTWGQNISNFYKTTPYWEQKNL